MIGVEHLVRRLGRVFAATASPSPVVGTLYNTVMLHLLLAQNPRTELPPALLLAVGVAFTLSLLAVLVSIRIARRMRAIGDAGKPADDPARDPET